MKVGILGGSFDPVHNGHIHMAVSAYQTFDLDQVWLIPAGHSPNKDEEKMTSGEYRYEMCQIATKTDNKLYVSRMELDCPERSYTYRTLEKLVEQYPENEFYFIMGGDSLDYLETWKHPEIITALAVILVVPRYPFEPEGLNAKIDRLKELFACDIRLIPCPEYPISSTAIRQSLAEGKPLEKDFPNGVLAYIRDKKLYTV